MAKIAGKKVTFTGALGAKLAAVMELPEDGQPRAYALFAHCFTCTKDIFSARYLTGGLTARGFAVLRFDFTGLGASEGEFENTNFSSNVQDLLCAADYLRAEHEAPALMVGHSLGGAAVLAAAGDIPELRAVATIGAPAEPAHVQHLFTDKRADIEKHGVAEVLLAGRPFRIKKEFLHDIEKTRLSEKIAKLGKALLIFHSVADTTVGIDNARKIYKAAKHPKSFISLDRADHLLSDKRDGVYVSDVLSAWAQRYLPSAAEQLAPHPAGEENNRVVVESIGSGLAHRITNGKHEMIADEPSSVGGANTGPTPYGYLLAALGACTAMTIRMYADFRKVPLKKVTVILDHEKKHAADCDGCEQTGSKIDTITRILKLEGDLTDAQRQKMMEIADKCPVHRTLHSPIVVTTTLDSGK